jgi:hypothetical protein
MPALSSQQLYCQNRPPLYSVTSKAPVYANGDLDPRPQPPMKSSESSLSEPRYENMVLAAFSGVRPTP